MKNGRRIILCLAVCLVLGLIFWSQTGVEAQAKTDSFKIEAAKLPTGEENYNIQLNIENTGADWEGIVRLTLDEDYRVPTAYDTVISLPQGSTKQFVVKVPLNSMEDTNGTITVALYDKKQEKVAEKTFKRFLKDEDDYLSMGILSDDYAALTYLDMGGQELYFYGDDYPIKLVEITQDNIMTKLDALEFLVIDTYNTGVLTDEELAAIENWNYNGGILIVGTGAYANDTLAAFDSNYGWVECVNIYDSDEIAYYQDDDYVDMTMLTTAELREITSAVSYNVQYMSHAWTSSCGDGAIAILPYSLNELGTMGEEFYQYVDRTGFVRELLDVVSMEANAKYQNSAYNNKYYNYNMSRRILRLIGSSNSPLNFGILKVLVIGYVIFVGPILYVILRMSKKRELYWVAVPAAALLGILLIFFAGRGFEVVDTRVYSVTMENLKGNRNASSYLYCYDASNKEWALQLSEGYQYAGALMNEQYGYNDDDTYYHHIKKEGETLTLGIKPSSNFEDSFFYAGGRESAGSGEIDLYGVTADISGIRGTVSNETDKDFSYFAVITNNTLYVYEGLAAGASKELGKDWPIYNNNPGNDIKHDYLYSFLNDIRDEEEAEALSALSALGLGVCSVYTEEDADRTFVFGVVENWDKTVNDKCSELAYGCLYVIE